MAHVIAGMTISIDGFVADSKGNSERLYPDLEELHSTPYMKSMVEETDVVDGNAGLVRAGAEDIVIRADNQNEFRLKFRWDSRWHVVKGDACISPSDDGWMHVQPRQASEITLRMDLWPHKQAANC